ncbi:MAG: amidoligase family protein [Nannocystaceae bacterium]|nr:amidoligase family protein [bacterium]
MANTFAPPPHSHAASGDERRVGLEVELSGLGVAELAEIVATTLDGRVEEPSEPTPTCLQVETSFGPFRIELDSDYFKNRRYLDLLERVGVTDDGLVAKIEAQAISVASELVPVELVSPPIPWSELETLEPLWPEIHARGGLGTHDAFRFAFGLHLNPEVPEPHDAACILPHLQAFLLLEPWLLDVEDVDWSRRVTPYIDGFPAEYAALCLAPDYAPTLDVLIEDYLRHSPTRNRVFDLLPLFEHVRPGCLEGKGVEGAHLVSARPTFHYRLPNSEVGQQGWSPASAWSNWVEVERLAVDDAQRRQLATEYLASHASSPLSRVIDFIAGASGPAGGAR